MRSDIRFSILMLGTVAVFAFAQDPPAPIPVPPAKEPAQEIKPAPVAAPTGAQARFYAEQFRRLRGEIDELKGAHAVQQQQTDKLKTQVNNLRDENRELNRLLDGNFAKADEVKALQVALKEMDANRLKDRAIVQKALGALGKLIQKVAQQKAAPVEPAPRVVAKNFKFNTHKVETGEFLGTIIIAYNRAYKEEDLGTVTQSQVLKANPGLNPNRLLVGQKIKIPLPGEIK
jgi:TolA-binding protein